MPQSNDDVAVYSLLFVTRYRETFFFWCVKNDNQAMAMLKIISNSTWISADFSSVVVSKKNNVYNDNKKNNVAFTIISRDYDEVTDFQRARRSRTRQLHQRHSPIHDENSHLPHHRRRTELRDSFSHTNRLLSVLCAAQPDSSGLLWVFA